MFKLRTVNVADMSTCWLDEGKVNIFERISEVLPSKRQAMFKVNQWQAQNLAPGRMWKWAGIFRNIFPSNLWQLYRKQSQVDAFREYAGCLSLTRASPIFILSGESEGNSDQLDV